MRTRQGCFRLGERRGEKNDAGQSYVEADVLMRSDCAVLCIAPGGANENANHAAKMRDTPLFAGYYGYFAR